MIKPIIYASRIKLMDIRIKKILSQKRKIFKNTVYTQAWPFNFFVMVAIYFPW